MKENYILYGILILVIAGLIFAFSGFLPDSGTKNKKVDESNFKSGTINSENQEGDKTGFKSIDSGTTGSGDVSVELTPGGIKNNQLTVRISVNTHSVSLEGFDLKEITTLEYGGKLIKPVDAPNLGGHHSDGELIFDVDGNVKELQ